MSTTDIGKYFGGVGYSAVSQTVRRLEKRRVKIPSLDRKIRKIEKDLLSQACPVARHGQWDGVKI